MDATFENSIAKNTKRSSSNDNLKSFQSEDLLCNLDVRVEFTETPETGNNGNVLEPMVFSEGNVLKGEINDNSHTVLEKSSTNTIYNKTNNNNNPLIASQQCKSRREESARKKRTFNLSCNKPVISTYITRRKSKQNMINNEKDLSDRITEPQPIQDTWERITDSSIVHSGNNQDSSDILGKSSILVQTQQKPLENNDVIVNDLQMPHSNETLVRMPKKPLMKKSRLSKTKNRNRKNKKKKVKKNNLNERPIFDSDNDLDNIVLSKLKENIVQEDKNSIPPSISETIEEKRNLHNFEVQENEIDKIKTASNEEHTLDDGVNYKRNESSLGVDVVHQVSECSEVNKIACPNLSDSDTSLLVEKKMEPSSKRPQRKKAKQRHYELSSDEDPFANVELSDSDTASKRKSKGYRYYSDEEYVPEKERKYLSSDSSIDLEDLDEENFRKKKRHNRKSDIGKRKDKTNKVIDEDSMEVHTVKGEGDIDSDIERCLQSSVIKVGSPTKQVTTEKQSVTPNKLDSTHETTKISSVSTTEFENFLANKKELKIKKVKENKMSIDIPILDQSKIKQMISAHSQTNTVVTKSMFSQTNSSYDIKLKQNINLSQIQSNNACEFLTSVLESTTELGQLMCEKSSEFLKKKVNANHVQDTNKLDNCVNKAFLLLKLAKENITTMEESLQKQYKQYLVDNNLIAAFEIDKEVTPTLPEPTNDSDCEIIEEPIVSNSNRMKKQINKLNPKTVFLNKELSIKIAKKTPSNIIHLNQSKKNLLFKGKHPAWISESVTVKKVKPVMSI
ncbi:hypothetical protein EVAR_34230_1 [Eumeta japonica]|uniref:Uncharacterized protein n=1 Tax=Eumeta variegata TaxID=151549 RepID=A0A4C1WZC7_EUMVA|nr:hypothetical protein EVAR_34230_1 [Eumeta japonica]